MDNNVVYSCLEIGKINFIKHFSSIGLKLTSFNLFIRVPKYFEASKLIRLRFGVPVVGLIAPCV